MGPSPPAWRCAGATWRMPLWRCSWLYQCTKSAAHCRAVSRSAKPMFGKSGVREVGAVLGGAEQRLGVGVVVAHPRARVRGRDAEPAQHGQHRGALHAGAVVAVQHRAVRAGVDALGQRRAPDQMSRVLGLVGLVHLVADDLAAYVDGAGMQGWITLPTGAAPASQAMPRDIMASATSATMLSTLRC